MFVTLDLDIADKILNGICRISILTWENGIITHEYTKTFNPDCELDEFFANKYSLTQEELDNSPYIESEWNKIYELLNNKTVYAYDTNRAIRTLFHIAEVNCLKMPNMNYGSCISICKRTWKGLENYNLQYISNLFHLTDFPNNSYYDARSIGILIYKALKDLNISSEKQLFHSIGYAGGFVFNNKKITYRAIKDKKSGLFYCKINQTQFMNLRY